MDQVKTATGYQGPVVVCAAAFRPIAGHRADSALVKYLSGGRDLELWLAPIVGTNVLGPYRLSVANLIGNLVIEAVRYESSGRAGGAGDNDPGRRRRERRACRSDGVFRSFPRKREGGFTFEVQQFARRLRRVF